tara:strand:+ start:30 stop:260 length:231 start_codon:yes stop_codon:yes gene_type:complete
MFTKEELESIKGDIETNLEYTMTETPENLYGHKRSDCYGNQVIDTFSNNKAWYDEVTLFKSIISKIDKKLAKLEED